MCHTVHSAGELEWIVRRLGFQPGWVRVRLWWDGIMTRQSSKGQRSGAWQLGSFWEPSHALPQPNAHAAGEGNLHWVEQLALLSILCGIAVPSRRRGGSNPVRGLALKPYRCPGNLPRGTVVTANPPPSSPLRESCAQGCRILGEKFNGRAIIQTASRHHRIAAMILKRIAEFQHR